MPNKIVHRVIELIAAEGLNNSKFEQLCKLSNGYINTLLKRNGDMGESTIVKILTTFEKVNPIWLVLGKGNMYKDDFYIYDSDILEESLKKIDEAKLAISRLRDKKKAIL